MHSINGNANSKYYSPFQLNNSFLSFLIITGILPSFIFGGEGNSESSWLNFVKSKYSFDVGSLRTFLTTSNAAVWITSKTKSLNVSNPYNALMK